jgi:hypothetical protein
VGSTPAQTNLVPNPSFEIIDSCNLTGGSITLGYAPGWFSPWTGAGGSPDLYNTCSGPSGFQVPSNFLGYQYPKTGNGYAGFYLYSINDQQEYIEAELMQPLIAGKKYCVEFFISLSNLSCYAINKIGVHFSLDSLLASNNLYIQVSTDVSSGSSTVTDTMNWVRVYGEFVANGNEKFLTIGHFYPDTNTIIDSVNNTFLNKAYYYIDDVSVIDCGWSGQNELANSSLSLFPNPSDGLITIELPGTTIQMACVYDVLTRKVFTIPVGSDQFVLNVFPFPSGLYHLTLATDKGLISRKIVRK